MARSPSTWRRFSDWMPTGPCALTAASGALAEVMTEFLLVEQSVNDGVNGCVARSGTSALVPDTLEDPDYILRDRADGPALGADVPIMVDGSVWGVLNIEAPEPTAFTDTDGRARGGDRCELGSSVHRASLVADLERTFTTT